MEKEAIRLNEKKKIFNLKKTLKIIKNKIQNRKK
jgi:hypothetical protein